MKRSCAFGRVPVEHLVDEIRRGPRRELVFERMRSDLRCSICLGAAQAGVRIREAGAPEGYCYEMGDCCVRAIAHVARVEIEPSTVRIYCRICGDEERGPWGLLMISGAKVLACEACIEEHDS